FTLVAAIFMAAVIAIPFSAGCGAPEASTAELIVAADSLGKETALPDRGGRLDMQNWRLVNEFLIVPNPETGAPNKPELAESWEMTADAKTWTFHLRKGVQWHDEWGEFTAEDVKFTFDLAGAEDAKGSYRAHYQKIDTVVKDKYTAVLNLEDPNWMVPSIIFQHLPIVCKKYCEEVGLDEANLHPVGTGPYKFHSRFLGDFVKLEAVPYKHWRVTPEFKYITIKLVPETSTKIAMLRTGEADNAPIPLDKYPSLQEEGVRAVLNPSALLYSVNFPSCPLPTHPDFKPMPWWDDPANTEAWENAKKVRKAMAMAINREEINERMFFGLGSIPESPYLYPSQVDQGYDLSWKFPPYDPDGAKQLLAEAGWPDGFDITMVLLEHSGRPDCAALGEAVAMYWEELGLTVERLPMDMSTIRPELTARTNEDGAWILGATFTATPELGLGTQCVSTGGAPFNPVEYALIDELGNKILQELDSVKRADLARQEVGLMVDNYFRIPLINLPGLTGLSDRVGERPMNIGDTMILSLLEYATLSDSAK
ncbi:ABC transporter substrate-binding protein, partial [Chloroflexota bacterium]